MTREESWRAWIGLMTHPWGADAYDGFLAGYAAALAEAKRVCEAEAARCETHATESTQFDHQASYRVMASVARDLARRIGEL